MPDQDPHPPVVDYFHPTPRRTWLASITGWDWTLLVIPAVAWRIWRITQSASSRISWPKIMLWMYTLVALRVAWAVLRRDRSRWWIAYLILTFALPVIAGAAVWFSFTPLGDQIATAMYHFWRDLF